jgi:signal transduction histidine kinase
MTALVCFALLAPGVTSRRPEPLHGRSFAAASAVIVAAFLAVNVVQLVHPGALDAGPAAHALLRATSAAAWAILAGLVLTSPSPDLSDTGRRSLARVFALLSFGHLLGAVDGAPGYLLVVLAMATRLVVAGLLLRAIWAAFEARHSSPSAGQERLSAALMNAVDAAQDQERSRAQLTHDARNACAGVRASLEILNDHGEELDSAARARLRQVAMFGVVHLEEVITRADPYARDFDVMDVVRRVVDNRRVLGASIAVLGSEVRAHGRPHDLATALLNVVVNAERHAAGTPLAVDVTVRDERVRICVTDGGPGIAREHQEDVFMHGWKGPVSTGHGLGLHAARELMRGQAGDLTLVPSLTGAAFVLHLPLANLAAPSTGSPPAASAQDPLRQPQGAQ